MHFTSSYMCSRRRAGETGDRRQDGGKMKERKTYDYLDDEFEGVEWRECDRTQEADAQQGGVEKKYQKVGALAATSTKELMTSVTSAGFLGAQIQVYG